MRITLPIHDYLITSTNKQELRGIIKEVFTQDSYYFETEADQPIILDLGAHVGVATHYFKRYFPHAIIYAVEPHPQAFQFLNENIATNRLDGVTTIEAAVTPSGDNLTLHVDHAENWLSTTSVSAGAWNKSQKTHPIQVPAITLKSLVERALSETNQDTIALLKMDIEGSEVAVIQHSKELFSKIEQIILEFHPSQENHLLNFLTYMKKHGFEPEEKYEQAGKKWRQLQIIHFKNVHHKSMLEK
jgi:FkbM family methyltransferase